MIKKILYYDLVKYQDETGDDEGVFKFISNLNNFSEKEVKAIPNEGALKKWPLHDTKIKNKDLQFIDPYLLKIGNKLSISRETPLIQKIAPENSSAA
ncbi:MAG: hypothetical protein JJE17_07770 [Peptostreptococcaceae bacterium]|nr:hypothetical protein [Peptostreptococcaceae bacterium]